MSPSPTTIEEGAAHDEEPLPFDHLPEADSRDDLEEASHDHLGCDHVQQRQGGEPRNEERQETGEDPDLPANSSTHHGCRSVGLRASPL